MNSTVTLNPAAAFARFRPAAARTPARERAYRRALRAAELAAWNAADPKAITRLRPRTPRTDRTENVVYFLLAAAVAAALLLGATNTKNWLADRDGLLAIVRNVLQ